MFFYLFYKYKVKKKKEKYTSPVHGYNTRIIKKEKKKQKRPVRTVCVYKEP